MQGILNEIDIRSILQLIELGQRTGVLFVETDIFDKTDKTSGQKAFSHRLSSSFRQQSWFVFFLNGQIVYASDGDSSLARVGHYLHRYRVKMQINERQLISLESLNMPEYGYLWMLLEQNIINPSQARGIVFGLVHEILFDLLSLHQGSFIFQHGSALAPQLTTLEIAPILTKIIKQLQEWKQLYPHIQSPDQFPVLTDLIQLSHVLPKATVNKLQHWVDGKTSLRQLARYIDRDIVKVAKAIYPYVEQGWVQLVSSVKSNGIYSDRPLDFEVRQKTRIVCIDNAIAVCETVESILKPHGYEVITLTNPLEALSLVFQFKPDLILCDTSMSELNGYEICSMLRHSTVFQLVPIIMLTSHNRFIDQAKARMVGATDYLTKPFGNAELVMLVEKYLNCSIVRSDRKDTRVVDPTII
ncbi:MAG: response regulator [Rhizonema sp. NSF051]|nr:response regulator [Rhizonema sp. NSF051]